MVWWKNEFGFTLASHLLRLLIILMSIPIIILAIQKINVLPLSESLAVQQFFFILQIDAYNAINIYSTNNEVTITLMTGETVNLHHYSNVIRRQVQGQGHEIYLRNVKSFIVNELPYGMHVEVTMLEGDTYERTIVYPKT